MSSQKPILTVTLNPAVDFDTRVDRVEPGPKLRLSQPRVDPGGGGVNVARAIVELGGTVQALVALGGATGMRLAGLLAAGGIDTLPFEIPGETRQSLSVIEDRTGRQFRFYLPGAGWPAGLQDAALQAVLAAAAPGGLVVLSGSHPPGVSSDFPLQLSDRLGGRAALVVDTSGAPLARLVAGPPPANSPEVLRMNSAEAEAAAARTLPDPTDSAAFGAALVDAGVARMLVIARGAEGSVLVTGSGHWLCTPPTVTPDSAVGAGDSFTGAFVLALARGAEPPQALVAGTAAAAAAILTPGTELCRSADVARLMPDCVLRPLHGS